MRTLRRLALTSAVLLSFAAFVAPGLAAGATEYVSPSGIPMPMGSSCAFPGYTSIQTAVTAAAPGDTIVVCDGVYNEQVTVDKSLTLAGSGNSIVQAPSTLPANGDVVTVTGGASVVMSGFTVRGPGPGGCASIGAGIRVDGDATLDVSNTTVRDITDNPFGGCQNGEGFRVGPRGTDNAGAGHLVADNVIVTNAQKNGMTLRGAGTTGKITNATVTGSGQTAVIAQNGIQVSDGAAATVSTSTIRDFYYTPKTYVACGLLAINANGVNDDNNVYLNDERDKCINSRGGTYEGAP